jgi:DNA-binding transcriptional LysR family regulator
MNIDNDYERIRRLLDWDDLRFILAIGRSRTLSAAARNLDVNHSTVFRRLAAVEKRLGAVLFERLRHGYRATPAGEEAVGLAERVEQEILELERRLADRDSGVSGSLRVTTTDTLLFDALAPVLPEFVQTYPEIELEIIVSNRGFSLAKREADVAIRPAVSPPASLVGSRICGIAMALYASKSYLAKAAPLDQLEKQAWVTFDTAMGDLPVSRWLREKVPGHRAVFRTNSPWGITLAARSGLGLAVLPCYLGDAAPELRRLSAPIAALERSLWLLANEKLRETARVRAFLEFMDYELRKISARFEGSEQAGVQPRDDETKEGQILVDL